MHDLLKERLWRTLESLPEERVYQVLDYVEFLGSKYARENQPRAGSALRDFGEKLEDHMRMNGVALGAIRGTMDVVGTADKVFSDITRMGRSFFREVESGLRPSTTPREEPEARGSVLPPGTGNQDS
ncbi:MAG: DUF2281 domain-containing protein [Gemmatimonadota bacterium]|jgi:hypothetical protein|nr:DUF2281 domain-containing protein [Gemmatimonadota bacterium]